MTGSTIHASAVLVGAHAALIRGPAGSGKSRLVLAILESKLAFTRLVADDRVRVEAAHGRLLLRPAPALVGLIESRGLGILRLPYEPVATAGWIIDLAAGDADRLPEQSRRTAEIAGVTLPRLAVGPGLDPLPAALALVRGGAHLEIEARTPQLTPGAPR